MSESDWLRRLIDWSMDYSGPSLGLQKGQLQLPFGRDEERSWTVTTGRREQVRLDVLLTRRGGQMRLTVPLMPDLAPHDPRLWRPRDDDFYEWWLWEDEDGISLRRAGLSPMVAGPSPPTACWTAEVQMAPWVGTDLPFVESELLLLAPDPGAVREVVLPPLRLVVDVLHADQGQVDAAALRPLAQSFVEVARHLCSLASLQAVETSRPFGASRSLRWFVYEVTCNDASGRLTQLATTCPGVLLLAHYLRRLGRYDRSDRILQAAVAGQRLGRVRDAALEAWCETLKHSDSSVPHSGTALEAQHVELQRVCIQRAGPLVSPHHLWRPPSPGVAAEDIPREPVANARWFRAMGTLRNLQPEEVMSEAQTRATVAFCSRHYEALLQAGGDASDALDASLGQLFDFVRHTGRMPSRQTDPSRLLAECDRWHRENPWTNTFGAPADQPLAVAGLADWTGQEVSVRVLRTAGDLYAEGQKMLHCVGSWVEPAVSGLRQFFHVEAYGAPLTVMTKRAGGKLVLVEVSGVANRRARWEERAAVEAWLAQLGRSA